MTNIELIQANPMLSEQYKPAVIAVLPVLEQMTNEEKQALHPLGNTYLYIAMCLTSPFKNEFCNQISDAEANINISETGIYGTFRLNNILCQISGMNLTINLTNSTHSTGKSKISRTTRSGKEVGQIEYSNRVRETKRTRTLSLISDESEIRKIFNI